MDTIYYTLRAQKVKVSGGADLVRFVPAAAPGPDRGAGEVLDFDRCRRRLETKAAWKALTLAAEEQPAQDAAPRELPPEAPLSPRERAAGWLELCASAAVIAVSLAAVLAFLRVL